MNKIFYIFPFLLVNLFTIGTRGAEIWKESFSIPEKGFWGDANGITIHSDMGGITNWSLNISSCKFIAADDYVKTVTTSGGRLEARDCKGEAVWTSEWINIKEYKDVLLKLTVAETGTGSNVANKYSKVYYQVDAQAETLCTTNGLAAGNFGELPVSQSGLNGEKLRVIIRINTTYASDKLIVDEILVEGEPKTVKKASGIKITECPLFVYTDQPFEIKAQAIYEDGSVDPSYKSPLILVDPTNKVTIEQASQEPIDGTYCWKNLVIKEEGSISIQIHNSEIGQVVRIIEAERYYQPFLKFDFEDQQFGNWAPGNDWAISNQSTIKGYYSLKHSDKATASESNIFCPVGKKLTNADYRWSLIMKNGDWDPSSSNRFWYYVAVDKNKTDQLNGWALGVDISGSDDHLELWRFKNGQPDSLIIRSDTIWKSNTQLQVEVERRERGKWSLRYKDPLGTMSIPVFGNDKTITPLDFIGLHYDFTSTRAGQFWADDITLTEFPIAPFVEKIEVVDQNQLQIIFNKEINLESAKAENFSLISKQGKQYKVNGLNPIFQQSDRLILQIETPDQFDLSLIASDVVDKTGLRMVPDTLCFMFVVPVKEHSIVINEILADPTPAQKLPEQEFLEIVNRENFPVNPGNVLLLVDDKNCILYPCVLYPDSFLVLSNTEGALNIPHARAIPGFPTLKNTGATIRLITEPGLVIDEISYSDKWYNNEDKQNGGWSLERIDPNRFCNQKGNWSASVDQTGGTPGKVNSVNRVNIDQVKPVLTSFKLLSDTTISLVFSEEIEFQSLKDKNNYKLDGSIVADSIGIISPEQVVLEFAKPFTAGQNHHLQVSGLTDLCANQMDLVTHEFIFFHPKEHSIVINEVFADPNPVVGLPEHEYLELYNRETYPLNLQKLKLEIDGKLFQLPDSTIKPGSYAVLTTTEGEQSFTQSLAITGFPALKNTGATIRLITEPGLVIDEISYSDKWYNNEDKQNGGWSLERIDPNRFCNQKGNWSASVDQTGGTPGKANSVTRVNIDSIKPELTSFKLLSDTTIVLVFSEEIESQSLKSKNNYKLDGSIVADSIRMISPEQVVLEFAKPFTAGQNHHLQVSGLTDLCANQMDLVTHEFIFFHPKEHSIVINEVFADPNPVVGLPEHEYLELYNRETYPLNLQKLKLEIDGKLFQLPDSTIKPGSYAVLTTTEGEQSFTQSLAITGFPALKNTGATIRLITEPGLVIDEISYSDKWYNNEDKQNGGWSLERIDPNRFCNQKGNWTASVDQTGGTPGKVNSVNRNNTDLIKPEIIQLNVSSANSIIMKITEEIEPNSLSNKSNYTVDGGVGEAEKIEVANPLFVKVWFKQNFEPNRPYNLTVKNLTDECGNTLNTTQLSFEIQKLIPNDLLISEILFNPYPGGADFVEIYNPTDKKINLKNIKLASRNNKLELVDISTTCIHNETLPPGGYALFTLDSLGVATFYFSECPSCYYVSQKFPSYPDDKGTVVLLDDSLQVIDEFNYSEKMHHPLIDDKEGISLERVSYKVDTNHSSNWHSAAASVGFATPAYPNSQSRNESVTNENITLDPEVFSPNNDGYNDRLFIHYQLDKPGYTANVRVYDSLGRLVTNLVKNETLAQEGDWFWDGNKSDNSRTSLGIYIVFIELFDLNGNVKKFRKTCTLTDRM